MSKITKKQFLSDVRHEIDMLKKHATDREKGRLDFETFNPVYSYTCIYGQLTGQCYSQRAHELMDLCCIRMFDKNPKNKSTIDEVMECVNGEYESAKIWKGVENRDFNYNYISSLEGYIFSIDAKNAQIIAYIKGETNTLVL